MSYEGKTVIGIIGGIGSGKTKVLELLNNNYDAVIIEADKMGHILQEPNQKIYKRIIAAFGEDILESTKKIDRKKLGAIVFADRSKLDILNNIMHPAIHEYIEQIIAKSEKKLIFIEGAILAETSLVELVDAMWYVYSDINTRLERLQTYRDISFERARKVMGNQPDDKYYREHCIAVIDNSFTEENTLRQINQEIKKIQEGHYE